VQESEAGAGGQRAEGQAPSPWPLLALAVASAAIYAVGFRLLPDAHPSSVYPWLFYPQLALWLAAVAWVWRRPRVGLPFIVAVAVALRLLALTSPPSLSSDLHRYAWDGAVQRAGISPYAFPPEADELAGLRDERIHPRINRPWARTVYPPGGQLVFLGLPFSITGVRLVMVAFDLVTILLLARLLGVLGLPPSRCLLYAWSPFVVWEVANNGHLEAAMLPLLVGAVLLWRSGRIPAAGLALGGAIAMKLYPALAVVALWRRPALRLLVPAAAVVTLLYLVYGGSAGAKVLGFLPEYVGSAEDHNIGLRALIQWLASDLPHAREVAFGVCVALLLAGVGWIARHPAPPEQQLLRLTGLYLLTLPTALHPWYALWLVPWLCMNPRASWMWLLAALPLSYLKYATADGVMPGWVVPLELVPVFVLLIVEWLSDRRVSAEVEA
jgi:hypothetical protein